MRDPAMVEAELRHQLMTCLDGIGPENYMLETVRQIGIALVTMVAYGAAELEMIREQLEILNVREMGGEGP